MNSNIFITILKYIIILYNFNTCRLSNCSYDIPIKKNNEDCIAGGCSDSEFKSGICTIENDIIKTQWLNKIIDYSPGGINYAAIATTPNGNLICGSSYFRDSTKKYYFGLKKNGRPFFKENGKETYFSITDSDQVRNEGNIFGIKLNGTNNEEEYIIAFGNNQANVEIYDFKDNNNIIVYKQSGKDFFWTGYNSFHTASIFKLKNTTEDYYIISIIAQPVALSNKCFFIMKFLFTSLDISTYTALTRIDKIDSSYISISSCFETENHYIFCFFLNREDNYIAIVYDYDLNRINNKTVASAAPHSIYDFYKCVHFTGEAGAFLYYDTDNNIAIQFKEFNSGNIKDYFTSTTKIKIINNNYNNVTKDSDMIKLGEKKFCFVAMSLDQNEFNLFIVNNYKDDKIKIRHYNLKINNLYLYKITDELKISLYNGLIAMACTGRLNSGSLTSSVIIFSFPNSTDFNLDITNNLLSFTNPIIKFFEKCNIENNIFGYIFLGVKIIDISKGYNLSSVKTNDEIKKDDILYEDDSARLDLNKDVKIGETGRIIYAMVLTEPDYDIFNQYAINIDNSYCGEYCEDEKENFQKNLYIGRNSYFDIYIKSDLITNNCEEINQNCAVCIKNLNICIICKFLYEKIENGGKDCFNENEDRTKQIDSTIETENSIFIDNIKTNEIIEKKNINIKTDNTANIESTFYNKETDFITDLESILLNKGSDIITNIGSTLLNKESNIITNIESTLLNKESDTITNIGSTLLNKESDIITNIESSILNKESNIITNIESTILNQESDIITNIESTILNQESNFITNIESTESTILNHESNIITNIESTLLNKENINISDLIIESIIINKSINISDQIEINAGNNYQTDSTISINSEYERNNKNDCTNEEILNNNCLGKSKIEQFEEIKQNILNENYNKENTIIRTLNIIVQFSKLEDQKKDVINLSNLDLRDCENKLKEAYKIPIVETLIIYKADIKKEGLSSTYVAFEVYDPFKLKQLNISICSDVEISINIPVEIKNEIEILYKNLNASGYNMFDKNGNFYNDICTKYTTPKGTDMILSDRRKDIYGISQNQNDSLCQNTCELKSYDLKTKKVKCNCILIKEPLAQLDIETIETKFNIKDIDKPFYETLENSNFRVLKCYKLAFNISSIKKNIGQIVISAIFIIFLILIIIFFVKGHKQITKFIKLVLYFKKINHKRKKNKKDRKRSSDKNEKTEKNITNEKSSKKRRNKYSHTTVEKDNLFSQKIKTKLEEKTTIAPPKKTDGNNNINNNNENINNNNSFILKRLEKGKISYNLSNKQINKNYLLNVPTFNSEMKKHNSSIYSNSHKASPKKMNHKNQKKYKEIYDSNLDFSFSKSEILFKNEEEKRNKFNSKNYGLLNDYEINYLNYKLAVKLDHRTYWEYYLSLLKQNQLIIFTFFLTNDYNIKTVKITLFLISFSLYFTINGFFFNDKSMHKIYKDNGEYGLLFRVPKIIYTSILSIIINIILKKLCLSQQDILEIKEQNGLHSAYKKSKKIYFILRIRISLFFIISLFLLFFFWYFISCFCAVFVNTQIILIKDTLISFALSFLYPFVIYLLPGIFRMIALRNKEKNKECFYNFGQLLSLI